MKKFKGFTLVEILVSLAVFGLVMAAAGGVLFGIYRNWDSQRQYMKCIDSGRWAMEFISRYIRHGGDASTVGGGQDEKMRIDTPIGDIVLRANHKPSSDRTLRFGIGTSGVGWGVAPDEILGEANIIPNASGNEFFDVSGKLVTLEFSMGEILAKPPFEKVYFYCRTKVRMRNN